MPPVAIVQPSASHVGARARNGDGTGTGTGTHTSPSNTPEPAHSRMTQSRMLLSSKGEKRKSVHSGSQSRGQPQRARVSSELI